MGSEGKWSSMKVEIQCKKLVKPSTPTPPHLQRLKISSIDQLQPPFYVSIIFHFNINNHDEARTLTTPEKLACLETSLSDVLSLYYPFAGRFDDKGDFTVSCQDQGVELVNATVDGKLYELLDGDYDPEILASGLSRFPILEIAENPLILIQLNAFNCGGLAIGFCFYHKIADMFTISTFMDAWATVCRLGTLAQSVHPSFDLSSFLPPKDNFLVRTAPLMVNNGMPPPRFVVKRYTFKGEAISKLKLATTDSKSVANYTRVELVTTLISSVIINIDGSRYGLLRPYVIAHMMNLRNRTAVPIKENSFGNFYSVVLASLWMENERLELRELASLVQNSIRSFSSEIGTQKEGVELSLKVENAVKELDKEIEKGEDVNLMMFSSWCRFPLYWVDFGWGRPDLVSPLPTPFVSVGLMDSKNDAGGIEAWVCLKEGDMTRFQHDSSILAYTS